MSAPQDKKPDDIGCGQTSMSLMNTAINRQNADWHKWIDEADLVEVLKKIRLHMVGNHRMEDFINIHDIKDISTAIKAYLRC